MKTSGAEESLDLKVTKIAFFVSEFNFIKLMLHVLWCREFAV